ncbi:MAG: hypothetical protein ACI8TP_001329 [Acidimicrobiales bacterium]|jgi:hypothetical protein
MAELVEFIEESPALSTDPMRPGPGERVRRILVGAGLVVGCALAAILARPTASPLTDRVVATQTTLESEPLRTDQSSGSGVWDETRINAMEERVEPRLISERRAADAIADRDGCCHDG